MLNLQQELSRLENRREKLNNDIENIIGRLWEDYELTYNSACELKQRWKTRRIVCKIVGIEVADKITRQCNVDSIEEYKAVEERFVFLTEQKSDLEKSKNELNGIIESMEELMKEHFGKQFQEINESFSLVFSELSAAAKVN